MSRAVQPTDEEIEEIEETENTFESSNNNSNPSNPSNLFLNNIKKLILNRLSMTIIELVNDNKKNCH